MPYTYSTTGPSIVILTKDQGGLIAMALSTSGAPAAVASVYSPGAMVIDTVNKIQYLNTGTSASPSFVNIEANVTPGSITGAKLSTNVGYFSVSVLTTGTTPVNVFGAGGAPTALTITSVLSTAQDTTAGNITLADTAGTVVAIAKGTTSGGVVGGVTLANTAVTAGNSVTVVSSSVGNSIVTINFTVA